MVSSNIFPKSKTKVSVKWHNSAKGETPAHGSHAIVDVNGEYYLTLFDAKERMFIETSEPFTEFLIDNGDVKWTTFKL
jgi:hypothetical protein